LLHDTNRGLYIVLTRYGRIGETGMHQRSPFAKIEDALVDFHTIFKQKTSNDFTDLDNFALANKKYNIV
jgi:poly [ADP-ribose] polymerase/centrosomal protein CEP128